MCEAKFLPFIGSHLLICWRQHSYFPVTFPLLINGPLLCCCWNRNRTSVLRLKVIAVAWRPKPRLMHRWSKWMRSVLTSMNQTKGWHTYSKQPTHNSLTRRRDFACILPLFTLYFTAQGPVTDLRINLTLQQRYGISLSFIWFTDLMTLCHLCRVIYRVQKELGQMNVSTALQERLRKKGPQDSWLRSPHPTSIRH